jgi:acyl-CoA thioester hydrolase
MAGFKFYYPITVRYGDLDPQGHVNNACYLTYFQEGRIAYIRSLGLWDGRSFLDVGIILADSQVTFKKSIQYGQPVQVGVRVASLGHKSLRMEYCLEDMQTAEELATGSSVLVAYDYARQISIPVPDDWRQALSAFEGL